MTHKKYVLAQVICLFPLVIAAPLGLDIFLPGVPMAALELGSQAGMTQWLISGFVLCLSLSQLFFGPVVDRWGSQRVLLCGCSVYALGALGVYFADGISLLITLRLVQGCGAGAIAVAVFASVPLRFHGAMVGKVFSILNGMISLVPVLAPIIGGALIVRYGWKSSFYLLGIFVLLCMVLASWRPLPQGAGGDTSTPVVSVFAGYLNVLRHSQFQLGCFAGSFGFATQLIFFSSSPSVLIETLQVPVDRFGYYFAINALAITGGSLLTAKLLGRVQENVILLAGALLILLAGVGFIITVYLFSISVWAYIVAATIGSLGFAVLIGTGAAIALTPFTQMAGRASALMAAIQMSFSSLVSWLVIATWNAQWSSMIVAYVLLAAAIMVLLYRAKVNTEKAQSV
ncbi:putative multidrug resistance protein [Serratia proteamaculans]|uniref:MFS transporter n=1 Tax=Serratia proteamaculans TaxID=28151 RepID=UPI0009F7A10B|nr:MFS transporter [Serratia proteamaculans]SMB36268.1 putative multidrug resistance protein [Serratia proteamaculans]